MISLWFLVLQCLIEVPDTLTLMTRPPVDCSMCRGVTQVDHVKAITPQEFEERWVARVDTPCTPISFTLKVSRARRLVSVERLRSAG